MTADSRGSDKKSDLSWFDPWESAVIRVIRVPLPFPFTPEAPAQPTERHPVTPV
jgi:hypothetical protein